VKSFSIEQLKIQQGQHVTLGSDGTSHVFGLQEKETKKMTKSLYGKVLELQEKLYAEKKQSLLIVFQAMDAAGKDSTIRKLTTKLNVQGARVQSFGKPSKKELAHDFLWRVHQVVPQNGEMVLFNRSHYEDVLIVKVHGWSSEETIDRRYDHINNFESLLADNNTKVIKIMLNISPEYQLIRFKSRLENPGKNWKFNPGDLDERKHWNEYMDAFSTAISRCSTEQAPWYVIPAEQRWFRDYVITRILLETLQEMDPEYPEPDYDASEYTVESIS
jgi:PPK2 family polyphosphate:nucleotide phosphotransferase